MEKNEKFTNILLELARSETFLSDNRERAKFYKQFEELYYEEEDKFYRHRYSDIFKVMIKLQKEDEHGSMEVLLQNLSFLVSNYNVQNYDDNGKQINITDCLKKLYDHVSLEMARFNYYDNKYNIESAQATVRGVAATLGEIKKSSEEYKDKIKNLEKKLHSTQQEYVAILGIFAAVILAFVGGITFSSSVLQNIASASIYRLLIVVDLLGFVLINTINLLFEFICHILGKEKKFFRFLKLFNIVCLVLPFLVAVAWFFGLDKIHYQLSNILSALQ